MVLGYVLLSVALAATVLANVLFTLSWRGHGNTNGEGDARLLQAGRLSALTATGGVAFAALFLMWLIANHEFSVAYVAEYSAKRSAARYLFAAFWGGQEGSILLWTFWTSVLGAILAFRSGDKTARVWPIFGLTQIYLLGLLLLKCPFALGAGPVPTDGRGLNPLLENPWMVIHPPILFLGFASTVIPWVWSVYGLVYRDWDGWAKSAMSWTLFSFATLGFGLSLGGYWAYETLGWGGFWGWDPVENSSLVPWLFLTALLHGIPIQRANGGFKVTNFVLAAVPFVAMNYGTFLTRTGLLGDFSVHSFSSLGEDGYKAMLGGLLFTLLVPMGLLIYRFGQIPKPVAYSRVVTREFGHFLASVLLGITGVLVTVGMSAPLLTKLVGKAAKAEAPFYDQSLYPIALILTVAMAATPYFAWRASDGALVLRRLFPAYAAAIAATCGMFVAGGRQPWMLLLFASATFAFVTNLMLVAPRLPRRESRKTVGGFVAHMGAAMTLMGVACLVAFTRTAERVILTKNQPVIVDGYTLTYKGMTTQPYDRDNNAIRISVEHNGKTFEANPRYYFAAWDNKDTLFANPPAIQRFSWGDLYIAYSGGPQSLDEKGVVNPNNGFAMKKPGDARDLGGYKFTFLGVEMDERARETLRTKGAPGMKDLPEITYTAGMVVDYNGQRVIARPQFTENGKTGGLYSVPAPILGPDGVQVMLRFVPPTPGENMDAVQFQTMNAPDNTEAVMVDVSSKPLVWFVWLGTLLYSIGGFIAYRRRAVELGLVGSGNAMPPGPAAVRS